MSRKVFKCIATEKEEQENCINMLELCGFVVWRTNTGAAKYLNKDGTERYVRYNFNGCPDIIGYKPGGNKSMAIPVYWEVKRQGGSVRPSQRSFINRAIADRCIAGIGTSGDLGRALREIGMIK